MSKDLEKLIESVVKDLRSGNPDISLEQDFLDMVDVISLLSGGKSGDAMKAVRYFISLMRNPELFVKPSKNNPSVGMVGTHLIG